MIAPTIICHATGHSTCSYQQCLICLNCCAHLQFHATGQAIGRGDHRICLISLLCHLISLLCHLISLLCLIWICLWAQATWAQAMWAGEMEM